MNRGEPGRLTALQSLMREWSALAPYSFIHAMRLNESPNVAGWQNAVTASMRELSISSTPITVERAATGLDAHLETELHRPFSPGDAPFRFFVVNESDRSHWFGAVIDHWAADDFSGRLLLKRIYSEYRAQADPIPRLTVRRSWPQTRLGFREWGAFLKEDIRMRRACRPSVRDPLDFTVRVFRRVLPEAALEGIRAESKRCGATFNDVLLAATAQSFSAARRWDGANKRNAVAIISAMDLRRFEPEATRNRFELLVSHFGVLARRPDEKPLHEVIQQVTAQTRQLKARPGTELLGPTLFLWHLNWSRRAKATFFIRGSPFVAGLSNVNFTGTWIERSGVTDYRRVGPTGPLVPMVLMITTFRGRIFIEVTFRTTAFSLAQAEQLIDGVIQRLPSRVESRP